MKNLGIECKKLMAKEIKERLKNSPDVFLTSFSSMPVAEQRELRDKLAENQASLLVVKNRIAQKAFKELDLTDLVSLMQGITVLALGGKDALYISKALIDFAAKHENFKILGAYVDQQLLDATSIKRLAAVPSKEVLLSQIVYGFNLPIQGLVNTLSATIKKFVVVINRISQKK